MEMPDRIEVVKTNIMVTGGAGYIGSHCCKALSQSGFLPIVYDNLSTGHSEFVRWGPLVVGDIRNESLLLETLEHWRPAAVMHFAALSSVAESVRTPDRYYDVNVTGTITLLNAMLKTGCQRIIFSSSGAVYGDARKGRSFSEADSCNPINAYGRTKWIAEQILSDYRDASLMRSFSLRYFNASGADPSATIGERRAAETHLIPLVVRAILASDSIFNVYGNDYDTPDGTAIRDYIHVNDLAAAHLLTLNLLLRDHPGDTLNLGSGEGFSVKEIISAIEAVAGRSLNYHIGDRRLGDPAVLVADTSKAKRIMGFAPTYDRNAIVETAWRWYLSDCNSK